LHNLNLNLIFGAPGCGKTTYLLNLLENLFRRYSPNEIAYVSFTKKGAYEGRDRFVKNFGYSEEELPYFRTIHSLAFRALKMSRYDMISQRNYREFSKAMNMNFLGYYTEDLIHNDDMYLAYWSLRKNNLKMSKCMDPYIEFSKSKMVGENYERYKKETGIKDFDDLLQIFISENRPLPVKVVIIDEAQDLTTLQWRFCEIAFKDCKEMYVAGDDDQAIYEWSGADIDFFLNLKKLSGTKVNILDQSYRLRENILNLSKRISGQIKTRVDKQFRPIDKGGNIFFHRDIRELTFSSEGSYFLLARNRMFLKKFVEQVRDLGLVYSFKDKLSLDKDLIKAIYTYEGYRKEGFSKLNGNSWVQSFLRKDCTITKEMRWFEAFGIDEDSEKYCRALLKNKNQNAESSIRIDTIHGVKGGEADNVVLFLNVTRRVYENFELNQDSLDSELRCLYVAITRAKKNLHLILSDSKFGYEKFIGGKENGSR